MLTDEYLPEHVDSALIALALAEREAQHLQDTYRPLYAESIDLLWVNALVKREDPAEIIAACYRIAL